MPTATPPESIRPIRLLPRELAEKIAAGEVIERPASVVKELVENSLDAGARNIRVEIEDGGRKRVRVEDDGHGIAEGDLLTALERHATSKIAELDDLWSLSTMGFRGEALPSIAAVSRFTLETRQAGESSGRRVYLEGARLLQDGPAQARRQAGTLAEASDLFYNVPARLKFLRSRSSEASQIRELLERIALCNPRVRFTLLSDGRKTLQLDAPEATSDADTARVAGVFGVKPDAIESFESQFEDIRARGWLDRDGRATSSRGVHLSVNGRMVRDTFLMKAALVALRPRMMEGEFPRLFLAIEVPPGDIDVNVHPAKSEVRFRRSRDVFQVVHGALDRLARAPTRPYYSAALPTDPVGRHDSRPLTGDRSPKTGEAERGADIVSDRAFFGSGPASPVSGLRSTVSGLMPGQPGLFPASADRVSYRNLDLAPSSPSPVIHLGGLVAAFGAAPGFNRLSYIGQLANTYLLFQDGDGLVLIDQHAAHERINYERIKAGFLASGLKAQPLLVSAVVKCSPEQVALGLDHQETFRKLGFEFEAFGENCLILRAMPEGLGEDGGDSGQMAPGHAIELFKAVLEELGGEDTRELVASEATDPARLSPKLERLLSTSACHASIRAGQALSAQQAKSLAAQMDTTPSSLNCPHGRPASTRLSLSQLEGLFKRS